MPNHVTNKIIFDAVHAQAVFDTFAPGGNVDFNALIPQPPQIYQGDTSAEDTRDFPCNWHDWNTANWGTKWNAYETVLKIEGDKASVQFDTAWSHPYPVMAAFANRYKIPFETRYFAEGHNFWGIETWGDVTGYGAKADRIFRTNKRRNDKADEIPLCIELKGYDPDKEEE